MWPSSRSTSPARSTPSSEGDVGALIAPMKRRNISRIPVSSAVPRFPASLSFLPTSIHTVVPFKIALASVLNLARKTAKVN